MDRLSRVDGPTLRFLAKGLGIRNRLQQKSTPEIALRKWNSTVDIYVQFDVHKNKSRFVRVIEETY